MKRLLVLVVTLGMVVGACGSGAEDPIPVEPDGGIGDGATPLPVNPDPDAPEPPNEGPFPVAVVAVLVEHPQADTVAYSIVCSGDTASVEGSDLINAEEACLKLGDPAVQVRLFDGPPAGQVCTEIYGGPDVATLIGTIDNFEFSAEITRTNGCGIAEWDRLLAGVLPPALGVAG